MPRWLLLIFVLFGFTLVAPIFVLGNTQDWRKALRAWKQLLAVLAIMAVPALLIGLGILIQS